MLAFALIASSCFADIRLPAVFSDHMVLQRDVALPVWGIATPGETIEVTLREAHATAIADKDGRFRATLDPIAASSAPLTLSIKGSASPAVEITDVLVGEVWVCGGQSNMEFPLGACVDGAKEAAAAMDSRIRLIKAPHRLADKPQFTVDGQWAVCSPQTAGGFTGVGYFFARRLAGELDVPVGLISTNWGGTHIQPWIPLPAMAAHPRFAEEARAQQKARDAFAACVGHQRAVQDWEGGQAYDALTDAYWTWYARRDEGWRGACWQPSAAHADWTKVAVPGALDATKDFDGLVWLRRTIDVPASWVGHDLDARLGAIDDSDTTWWNGQWIGRMTGQAGTPRFYGVAKEHVKAGLNELVIALVDDAGGAGLTWSADELTVRPRDLPNEKPLTLAGEWSLRVGAARASDAPAAPQSPRPPRNPALDFRASGAMFDGMIAPFVPYAIGGAIWYQGESNEDEADAYRDLLPLLITSWRDAWGQGAFPFGIVQLANFRGESDDPVQGGWALLRDAQLETLRRVPATGLAVTIDVGDAGDIHPRDKKSVGERLAGWALSERYGRELEWSGPLYRSSFARGNELVVAFDQAQGLKARDGKKLDGFALAGADGKFVWADARIDGDRVILSSPSIAAPTAARYAWSDNPTRANLVNAAGLPASPFRTDR